MSHRQKVKHRVEAPQAQALRADLQLLRNPAILRHWLLLERGVCLVQSLWEQLLHYSDEAT